MEFEKLLMKCDVQEPEEQTIIRYLGELEPKYADVVELQQFTTSDEVCVLAHKVEQQRRRKLLGNSTQNPPKMSPYNPYPLNKPLTRGVQTSYRQSLPRQKKSKLHNLAHLQN